MANIKTTEGERIQARLNRYRRRKPKKLKHPPKARSVRAVSGGLPSLGKRR